ncbi:hypothetical protein AGMMS49975_27940 [Clostridia bacterium]|nr:hypothetical protein AGMMS49975_27940 [Clostridia bacterium]
MKKFTNKHKIIITFVFVLTIFIFGNSILYFKIIKDMKNQEYSNGIEFIKVKSLIDNIFASNDKQPNYKVTFYVKLKDKVLKSDEVRKLGENLCKSINDNIPSSQGKYTNVAVSVNIIIYYVSYNGTAVTYVYERATPNYRRREYYVTQEKIVFIKNQEYLNWYFYRIEDRTKPWYII